MEKTYRLFLYRYRQVRGYDEEKIMTKFSPAKVDGFGTVIRQRSPLYDEKYGKKA